MSNDVLIHVKAKDDASKTIGKMGGALKAGIVAGAAAAGAALVKFGIDSVRAAGEAQDAQLRLSDAFAKFPKLADTNINKLNSLNSALQLKTKADDESIASGQAVLAQFSLTGKQLEQMTPLLVDYAQKTGKEMPDAAKALGKALMGNGRALKEIGINFKDTGDPAKNFELIMDGLREKVGGFAEREGATLSGRLEILRNRFGEIQEKVGTAVLPVLEDLASAVGDVFDKWEGSGQMEEDLAALAEGARNAQEAFSGFQDANETFKNMMTDSTAAVRGWRVKMLEGLIKVADAWGTLSPRGRAVAKELRRQLVDTKHEFNVMANAINDKKIQPKLKADKREAEAKIRDIDRQLSRTHNKRVQTRLRAEKAQAQAAIASITAQLNRLNGKTATTYIRTVRTSTAGGSENVIRRAAGGPVGAAASGGPRSGSVLVGERGPEVVELPTGSRVFPNGNTKGGNTGDIYLTLDLGEGITQRLRIHDRQIMRAVGAGRSGY